MNQDVRYVRSTLQLSKIAMSGADIRQADSRFRGTNGFADPIAATMSEAIPELSGMLKTKTVQELRELANKRALAEITLHAKGTYGPG